MSRRTRRRLTRGEWEPSRRLPWLRAPARLHQSEHGSIQTRCIMLHVAYTEPINRCLNVETKAFFLSF